MSPLDPPGPWTALWKNLPAPVQPLIRPWLLVSLLLHGMVLTLPLLSEAPPEVPEPDRISLTPMPTVATSPRLPRPVASSSPSSVATPSPAPPPLVAPPSPVTVRRSPPPAVLPQPAATPTPSLQPSPGRSPAPQATLAPLPVDSPSPEVPETAWADFPHGEGTVTCEGQDNCWQTPETQWRSLAHTFQQTLQSQGYVLEDITEQQLSSITGRRIYAVKKDGETQYFLNVVSTPQGTRYVNSEEPLSEAELNQLSGL